MKRPSRRPAALLLALLTALLAAVLVQAAPASAHAVVVASDPADGARLAAAPAQVSFTFDESVGLNSDGYLHVANETGQRVDAGEAGHPGGDGTKVSVALKSGLGDGTYLASYRVVSADSHPISGSIRFVVGDGALAEIGSATPTVNPVTNQVYNVVRWIGFGGLAVLGGLWLLVTIWPQGRGDNRVYRLVLGGWWATTIATVAQLLLQGAYAAGVGLGGVTQLNLLNATLHGTIGTADSVRLLVLAALAFVLRTLFQDTDPGRLRGEVAALLVGIVVTFAFTGHADAQDPRWLALTSQMTHLTAMAVWLGGLAMLLVGLLPRAVGEELDAVLPRFSLVAYGCVAVLAVSGTYQAWLGIGSWSALTGTRYGQLVIAKVVLFGLMLGVAYFSRQAVQRSLGRHDDSEVKPISQLRRSVLGEAAIGVVVLAVTAVLVVQPPGRNAELASYAAPTTVSISLSEAGGSTERSAELTVTPSRAGTVEVNLRIAGTAVPLSVTGNAYLAAKELGPVDLGLKSSDGLDFIGSALLPAAGSWKFTITVRYSEFDSVTADTSVQLH
ncbi:copper transport protein [Jatrophihabitans sp. GAS493]|uniref:copper resistance CopC/CopD family protein n=1 Tax=Jatrophihabitans sp. GAS493 TaxID=1907575 RepID=UPI000BC0E242|nr:CopD family protein [Jatrophihabitans sp. GAS493]SOD75083.1 copper transport protein [Jatrophihabitans sp. GAS493]